MLKIIGVGSGSGQIRDFCLDPDPKLHKSRSWIRNKSFRIHNAAVYGSHALSKRRHFLFQGLSPETGRLHLAAGCLQLRPVGQRAAAEERQARLGRILLVIREEDVVKLVWADGGEEGVHDVVAPVRGGQPVKVATRGRQACTTKKWPFTY